MSIGRKMAARITLQLIVPGNYRPGDYARLHGDNGSGTIDWETPINDKIIDLFPDGAGRYGWGRLPWGNFPWGRGLSMRTPGWGRLPWGRFPWGRGAIVIKVDYIVYSCGTYKFGFACCDEARNQHVGTPSEVSVDVHVAPLRPVKRLALNNYNKTTNTLTLDIV